MLTLEKVKAYCRKKHNLPEFTNSGGFSNDAMVLNRFYDCMNKNPLKVKEIEDQIAKGIDFRSYFENTESAKKLLELRTTDPDLFYTILRKEELFINTCLITFGFQGILISLNPDNLIDMIDDDEGII